MLTAIIAVIAGLIGLVWSADRFTEYAAGIAAQLGMSQLMIGLTIVALGTSAPEIIVSINAAMADAGNIALGNAIGSNLANTGLVLGVTALILPIASKWSNVRIELLLLLAITFLGAFLLWDLELSRLDGFLLLAGLFLSLTIIIIFKLKEKTEPEQQNDNDDSLGKLTAGFVVMLLVLIISANILVWGAKTIATELGVSELVIGLTIVAIGTSLPELAASLASALKKHHDIALGAIIGSNIFNIGGVLGVAGVIQPFTTEAVAIERDYLSMLAITILLALFVAVPVMLQKNVAGEKAIGIGRIAGGILLAFYLAYNAFLLSSTL